MDPLANRNILLGVTGSVAAYKSCELVRRLRTCGGRVRVVLTPAAARLVGPLTFQALSGESARVELFDPIGEAGMDHIALARWAEVVIVAPASADFIARLAHGMADDLLTTVCLATEASVLVAPAMNRVMWEHPATRANTQILEHRGVVRLGPELGDQACGEIGLGRMLEPWVLERHLARHLSAHPLAGVKVLVSAGPTREAIDPVRFIANRSSGKMGFALAQAAYEAGAEVTLVAGPVTLPDPVGVRRIDVESAGQMCEAVLQEMGGSDIYVAAAAVADYAPTVRYPEKLKRSEQPRNIVMGPTPDVVAAVVNLRPRPFIVAFAAETGDLRERARQKLRSKGVDMVAANLVGSTEGGFEADDNALLLVWSDGEKDLPMTPKSGLARQVVSVVSERYRAEKG